jgi:hypothetical protein
MGSSPGSQICYHCTIHNLYQPELIPRQLSLSACPYWDVVCVSLWLRILKMSVSLLPSNLPFHLLSYLSSHLLSYCGGEIGATQHVVGDWVPGRMFLRSGTSSALSLNTMSTWGGIGIGESLYLYRTFEVLCLYSFYASIYLRIILLDYSSVYVRRIPSYSTGIATGTTLGPFVCSTIRPVVAVHYQYSVHPLFPAHYLSSKIFFPRSHSRSLQLRTLNSAHHEHQAGKRMNSIQISG